MTRQKASYIIQNGIGSLENGLWRSLSKAKGAFTLMFDKTTTTHKWIHSFVFGVKTHTRQSLST